MTWTLLPIQVKWLVKQWHYLSVKNIVEIYSIQHWNQVRSSHFTTIYLVLTWIGSCANESNKIDDLNLCIIACSNFFVNHAHLHILLSVDLCAAKLICACVGMHKSMFIAFCRAMPTNKVLVQKLYSCLVHFTLIAAAISVWCIEVYILW